MGINRTTPWEHSTSQILEIVYFNLYSFLNLINISYLHTIGRNMIFKESFSFF